MIYIYDKKEIRFKKLGRSSIALIVGGVLGVAVLVAYGLGRFTAIGNLSEYEKEILLINLEHPPFTEDDFVRHLKEVNVKFPHIVMAQAYLESSYKGRPFNSPIFKENHNMFGMKEAKSRPTTALGTKRNHAYFRNWEYAVVDYALYQSAFLRQIKTEEQYFRYLAGSYAEDPNYISKVRKLAQKFKSKF
jgi:hypothetical protein